MPILQNENRSFLIASLCWTPRILSILFILFLSLFSLDVFGEGSNFWKTAADFLIHNIPTFILIVILILSWKRPWIGGLCFIALGVFYLLWLTNNKQYPIIYLPIFSIGVLFIFDWIIRRRIQNSE
jgi:hypothetical protein